MTSPVEEMQDPALTSFEIEQVNNLEISPDDLPDVDAAARRGGRVLRTGKVVPYSGIVIEWIKKLISPITQKRFLAAEGVSEHGNGMPRELGHEAGDLEIGAGGSLTVNNQGGFTDDPDQEGTEGLIPEGADQVSVGFALLDDFTDPARMAEYLRNPKTYLSGLLIYGLHSSFGMLKEGFPRPTPAKKALWYLLFGNVGTIFVLATMLAWAPRESAKARLLVNCITAAGFLMFGLNLALLYLKYQP